MNVTGTGAWAAPIIPNPRDLVRSSIEPQWRPQVALGALVALAYVGALAYLGSTGGMIVAIPAVATIAVAVVWPVAGLASIAFLIPVREPDMFAPIYLDALVVGATALGCLLRLAGDRRPIRLHPGVLLLLGYGLYSAASVLPALNGYPPAWASSAASELTHIVTGIGLFIVASYLFRYVPIGPIIALGLVSAGLGALAGVASYLQVSPVLGVLAGLLLGPAADARASGGFSNSNYFGFFLVQALLLAVGSWLFWDPRSRPAGSLLIVVLVTALVQTFSRQAYIAATVGLLVMVAIKSRPAAAVLAVAVVAVAAIAYPIFLQARLGTDVLLPKEAAALAQSEGWRQLAFRAGLTMFAGAPIFGIGFGFFHFLSPPLIGASPATFSHNAFVALLAEQGLVGAAMVAGLVMILAHKLWHCRHPLRNAALAMVAGYLIQSAFINSTTSFQISGLTWLTMAAVLGASARGEDPRSREI